MTTRWAPPQEAVDIDCLHGRVSPFPDDSGDRPRSVAHAEALHVFEKRYELPERELTVTVLTDNRGDVSFVEPATQRRWADSKDPSCGRRSHRRSCEALEELSRARQ